MLDTLMAKLLEPVTLCHYTPGTAVISPVAVTRLDVRAIVAAMDSVSSARLGPGAPAIKA